MFRFVQQFSRAISELMPMGSKPISDHLETLLGATYDFLSQHNETIAPLVLNILNKTSKSKPYHKSFDQSVLSPKSDPFVKWVCTHLYPHYPQVGPFLIALATHLDASPGRIQTIMDTLQQGPPLSHPTLKLLCEMMRSTDPKSDVASLIMGLLHHQLPTLALGEPGILTQLLSIRPLDETQDAQWIGAIMDTLQQGPPLSHPTLKLLCDMMRSTDPKSDVASLIMGLLHHQLHTLALGEPGILTQLLSIRPSDETQDAKWIGAIMDTLQQGPPLSHPTLKLLCELMRSTDTTPDVASRIMGLLHHQLHTLALGEPGILTQLLSIRPSDKTQDAQWIGEIMDTLQQGPPLSHPTLKLLCDMMRSTDPTSDVASRIMGLLHHQLPTLACSDMSMMMLVHLKPTDNEWMMKVLQATATSQSILPVTLSALLSHVATHPTTESDIATIQAIVSRYLSEAREVSDQDIITWVTHLSSPDPVCKDQTRALLHTLFQSPCLDQVEQNMLPLLVSPMYQVLQSNPSLCDALFRQGHPTPSQTMLPALLQHAVDNDPSSDLTAQLVDRLVINWSGSDMPDTLMTLLCQVATHPCVTQTVQDRVFKTLSIGLSSANERRQGQIGNALISTLSSPSCSPSALDAGMALLTPYLVTSVAMTPDPFFIQQAKNTRSSDAYVTQCVDLLYHVMATHPHLLPKGLDAIGKMIATHPQAVHTPHVLAPSVDVTGPPHDASVAVTDFEQIQSWLLDHGEQLRSPTVATAWVMAIERCMANPSYHDPLFDTHSQLLAQSDCYREAWQTHQVMGDDVIGIQSMLKDCIHPHEYPFISRLLVALFEGSQGNGENLQGLIAQHVGMEPFTQLPFTTGHILRRLDGQAVDGPSLMEWIRRHGESNWPNPLTRERQHGIPPLALPHMLAWRFIRLADPTHLPRLIEAWQHLQVATPDPPAKPTMLATLYAWLFAEPLPPSPPVFSLRDDRHMQAIMSCLVAWHESLSTSPT